MKKKSSIFIVVFFFSLLCLGEFQNCAGNKWEALDSNPKVSSSSISSTSSPTTSFNLPFNGFKTLIIPDVQDNFLYANYPSIIKQSVTWQPNSSGEVLIPISLRSTSGILIKPKELGKDPGCQYFFQIAEVKAW